MDLLIFASIDWQTVVAIICVIAAATVIARRALGWLTGATRSGCSSCPANQSKPVVPMSSLTLSDSLKKRTTKSDGQN